MKIINVLQNAKNSPFFKVHFKMRVLAFLMVFFVLISPFYGIKKVKANPVAIGGSAIVALILSGLAAQGLISGEYTVTAAQLTQINDLAQAQLALEGATAVAAAQKLGDALAAGAESAKIKALATGGVIYAFLQAIQDILFPDKTFDRTWNLGVNERVIADFSEYVVTIQVDKDFAERGIPARGWFLSTNIFKNDYTYVNNDTIHESNATAGYLLCRQAYSGTVLQQYYFETMTNKPSGYYSISIGQYSYPTDKYAGAALGISKYISQISGNAILDNSVTNIASASSVSLPTRLSTTVVNNINNWDSTSDLVLAPPLPYDIPDDERLVVDPTYGGEVIDPTDPVDPPAEEEGISLPWLSALLALLGLGKLTGIDEGVLSGIDSIVDGITSTIQDVIDGVKTTAGEWATAATAAITSAISGIQSGISSIADTISHAFDPPSKDIDWDKLKSSGLVIFTKFPFSIPADLKFLVGLLVSDPQAPKWTVTVPFSIVGDWAQDGEFVLDFSVIDGFMVIVRNIELLAFIFGMVFMTRQLIWK